MKELYYMLWLYDHPETHTWDLEESGGLSPIDMGVEVNEDDFPF